MYIPFDKFINVINSNLDVEWDKTTRSKMTSDEISIRWETIRGRKGLGAKQALISDACALFSVTHFRFEI